MKKPNLSKMWETFVKIPSDYSHIDMIRMIRFQLCPIIHRLETSGMIEWYCFLRHNRKSGVPTSQDDDNSYFHLRFALTKEVNTQDFLESLPDHCLMTRAITRESAESIAGVDKSLLKNQEIKEAWRVIGEASQWVVHMLSIYKDDVDVPIQQIAQFLHYYSNMVRVKIQ